MLEITEEMLDAAPAGRITELSRELREQRAERLFFQMMLDEQEVVDALMSDAQASNWLMTLLGYAKAIEGEEQWREAARPLTVGKVFYLANAARQLRKHVARVIDQRAERLAER